MPNALVVALFLPASLVIFTRAINVQFIGPDIDEEFDDPLEVGPTLDRANERKALHAKERDAVEKELLREKQAELAVADARALIVEKAVQARQEFRAGTFSREKEMKDVRERLEQRMVKLHAQDTEWRLAHDSEAYETRVMEEQDRLLTLAVKLRKEAEDIGRDNHVPIARVLNISAVDLMEVLIGASSAVQLGDYALGVKELSEEWQKKIGMKAVLAHEISKGLEALIQENASSRVDVSKGMLRTWNLTADLFSAHQHDTELYVRALQDIAPPALRRSLEPLAAHLAVPAGLAPGTLDLERLASHASRADVCIEVGRTVKAAAPVLALMTRAHTAISAAAQVTPMLDVLIPDCPEKLKSVMQRILNVAYMQTVLVEETASSLVRKCGPVVRSFQCERKLHGHHRFFS